MKNSDIQNSGPGNQELTFFINELEVLKDMIRKSTEEKTQRSKWQRFSTHPMAIVIVSVLLTTVAGGVITYYYNGLQQEAAARRSFSDEVNKIRVQKVGEVWERLDEDEVTMNRLLEINTHPEQRDTNSGASNQRLDDILKLINDDKSMVSKYRFWLGESMFEKTSQYLDLNVKYALNKLTSPNDVDLTEIISKRENAKLDILQIRQVFLKGESNP